MSRNNSHTTGNLLYYLYDQKYYKLIGIDLSGQTNTVIPQEIDFVGKLEENDGDVYYCWNTAKNYFKIFLDLLTVTE